MDTPNPLRNVGQVIQFHLDNSKLFLNFLFIFQFFLTMNSHTVK